MIFSSKQPIFETVANYFENLIRRGVLKEGDALPSVRDVAYAEKINPNTVVRAYALLSEKGLVASLPKKGYFVKASKPSGSSQDLRVHLKELLDKGYTQEEIIYELIKLKEASHD